MPTDPSSIISDIQDLSIFFGHSKCQARGNTCSWRRWICSELLIPEHLLPLTTDRQKDIYRGTIEPQRPVCLKVLRLAMEQDEDIRDKIRKVCFLVDPSPIDIDF